MGRTSWWGRISWWGRTSRGSRPARKRRGIIAVSVLVLFLVGATIGAALSHHGTARQCVDSRSMKVAASARCQSGGGPDSAYRWYYGSAGTQIGRPARGGSFTDPDEQGQSNQNGSGSDDDNGGGSGGGGGDDDSGGGSGGGGADDG